MRKTYRVSSFAYSANQNTRPAVAATSSKRVSPFRFFPVLAEYIRIRFRQVGVMLNLILQLLGNAIVDLKSLLVRNMYWGRTSFYKTFFHVLVIVITTLALYSGLDSRIASIQRDVIENVSVSEGYLVDSDVVSQQSSFFPLAQQEEESDSIYTNYTVVAGDSLAKISQEWNVREDTLRWANNIPAGRDTLTVGQSIKIPKVDGVLYTVKEGDTVDSVLAKVQLKDKEADKLTFLELNREAINSSGNLIPGSTVILYDATLPQPRPSRPSSGGGSRPTTVVNTPAQPSQAPPGRFVNPLQLCSYRYSRGYSYGHTGLDLGVNPGCWVVAASSGTVIQAGWCFSLGYCVAIRHANGYSTIYGHGNGVLGVSVGQQVVAGQRIMQSGCTGLCFGPHVHISIAANNQDVYSCYRCRINPRGIIPY
jgi:murein DD-endopeptidase MepM/ murein hydrolase activator NlpD